MMRKPNAAARSLILSAALALVSAVALRADDATCPCPPPKPPEPLWTGSVGLSYIATSGNSDTSSLGLAAAWSRKATPWGVDIVAAAQRAEDNGTKTAERYFGGVRGKRALGDHFEVFAGVSDERNQFAGFDSRLIGEAGGVWHALVLPKHDLAFDAGLTWTSENPVLGKSNDEFGGLAGLTYSWKVTENATFRERLIFYPSFENSDDWRFRSETSFEAAFAASWALRAGYRYDRDNHPVPGFEKTDSITSLSLVWKM